MLYILFLLSGASSLIYQVVWVRQFGHAFGNTVHSAALVVAVFMLGLGAGGYLLGRWADRRHAAAPGTLLRDYAVIEGVIAALGLGVSLLLPTLDTLVATLSAYAPGEYGWQYLTTGSYLWRALLAVGLLTPITLLMGGTLTVLIRHLVRDLRQSGQTVSWLYGVNTFGAAIGAFITDFALVPAFGLFNTQLTAVALNVVAACGALGLAWRMRVRTTQALGTRPAKRRRPAVAAADPAAVETPGTALDSPGPGALPWASLALACSGFAFLGLEILWLRHAGILLGGFRAVFSLLLTVLLTGIGAGALIGGWLVRRHVQPGRAFMLAQGLFVATVLGGLAIVDADLVATEAFDLRLVPPGWRVLLESWFNLRPLMLELGLPAVCAGVTFPLANAVVQRVESAVGARAGVLYLANTLGAVAGSVATGYLLLPVLGLQASAAVLAALATLAIGAMYMAVRGPVLHAAVSGACAVAAVLAWVLVLPPGAVATRAVSLPDDADVLAMSEGRNELITVVRSDELGLGLLTNGFPMASVAEIDQRYMRALAHIPLLSMERPERVLVIGFGVGNSTHAATLHPSVTRVEVADLSRHILEHAPYFREANRDVLDDPRVEVFVNDGRQHLRMVEPAAYDLITLEPPPIAHAGVAALYSREFYTLARSRLAPGGYLSQWLPAYQVPAESSLAMTRAFLDVFPQSVLLSGAPGELLLLGVNGAAVTVHPEVLAARLDARAAARADLARISLDAPRHIVGTFAGSAATMARATAGVVPVTDDWPIQEYGVRSQLTTSVTGVPASLFDMFAAGDWCPACFVDGAPAPVVADLDLYLLLSAEVYRASLEERATAAGRASDERVMDSAFLAQVLPDTAPVHNILGVEARRRGAVDEAVAEFEGALTRDPAYENARRNLMETYLDQGAVQMEAGYAEAAIAAFEAAIAAEPNRPEPYNALGVVLAGERRYAEAAEEFRKALTRDAGYTAARDNLARAEAAAGQR